MATVALMFLLVAALYTSRPLPLTVLLSIAAVALAPFYPQAALPLVLFGLVAELPLGGAVRLGLLALSIPLGYIMGVKTSRLGLSKIVLATSDHIRAFDELNKYDIIVKGPDAFYTFSRSGERTRGDFVFYLPRQALLYRCKNLRCLPLRIERGNVAVEKFKSLLGEWLFQLFPEMEKIEMPLIIYTNQNILDRLINRLNGKIYILSNNQTSNISANIYDVPVDKAVRAVSTILKRAYGLWDPKILEEIYGAVKDKARIDPNTPGALIIEDILRGLDSWTQDVDIVGLGDDPKSILKAYLLYIKYGGFIIVFSYDIFNIFKELEVKNIILITKDFVSAKNVSYIIVGPISISTSTFFDKYIEKLNINEYVGYVAGVPVHGYL
ncbi:MAG: hypothetical protein ABWJ97_01530 [Thermoproteus sp.]